jgi:hypothetical protein
MMLCGGGFAIVSESSEEDPEDGVYEEPDEDESSSSATAAAGGGGTCITLSSLLLSDDTSSWYRFTTLGLPLPPCRVLLPVDVVVVDVLHPPLRFQSLSLLQSLDTSKDNEATQRDPSTVDMVELNNDRNHERFRKTLLPIGATKIYEPPDSLCTQKSTVKYPARLAKAVTLFVYHSETPDSLSGEVLKGNQLC